MQSIVFGGLLIVDPNTPTQETVNVVAITAETFSAIFAHVHGPGVRIINSPQVGFATTLLMSLPRPVEQLFVLEKALDEIIEGAIPRVRVMLRRLELCEEKLEESLDRMAVDTVDEVKLRGVQYGNSEQDAIEREYIRWSGRLADIFGVGRYPFSDRYNRPGVPKIRSATITRN